MLAKPSKAQYEWHELERIMFIHFGPATWQGREGMTSRFPRHRSTRIPWIPNSGVRPC